MLDDAWQAWQSFVPPMQTASVCLHLLQGCRATEPPLQLHLPIPATMGRFALHQCAVQHLMFSSPGLPAAGGAEHIGAQRPQRKPSLRCAGGVVRLPRACLHGGWCMPRSAAACSLNSTMARGKHCVVPLERKDPATICLCQKHDASRVSCIKVRSPSMATAHRRTHASLNAGVLKLGSLLLKGHCWQVCSCLECKPSYVMVPCSGLYNHKHQENLVSWCNLINARCRVYGSATANGLDRLSKYTQEMICMQHPWT